ncbi:hypothetical protein CEQ90_14180 [Lewinellaceae bacterium SD302]|nr:hypothetical protein CEQ90_14180 [Lewinellaceae bacterium SD302]
MARIVISIYLLIAGSLGLQQQLLAQEEFTVSFFVVDQLSNEPLEFVNILLLPGGQGQTTDEKGKAYFQLTEGRLNYKISYLGYQTQEKSIYLERDLKIDVILEGDNARLETILVTGESDREILANPEMGVQSIGSGELKRLPAVLGEVDVLKGLQLVSGVNAAGEASNGVSVRGGTIDQNLTLLDGAPVFTPTHVFGLFSVFTPDAVGSVDLFRANIPAEYGGRIASVIDVRSRNPTSDQLKLSGGIGLVSSYLTVETPLTKNKKLKLLAGSRVGLNDFLFSFVERLKRTKSRFADGTLKLRYQASETSIFTLSGFYSYDFYQLELINSLANINSSSNQYRYQTLNGSLEWLRLRPDGKGDWRTRLINANYQPELLFPEVQSPVTVNYRSRVRQQGLKSRISREIGKHRLKYGLEALLYSIEPGELDPAGSSTINPLTLPVERGAEAAAFVEIRWQFGDRLNVQTGLRYAHYAQLGPSEQRVYQPGEELSSGNLVSNTEESGILQDYGGLEPRLGISYQLNERNSLKLAYAESRQYLQQAFNATTPLPTSRFKVADNNILPQTGRLLSLGWAGVLSPGRYRATAETYYRRVNNILEYKPGADLFLETDVETQLLQGKSRAYGIELSVEKISGKLTGKINYTYSRAFNLVKGPSFSTSVNEGNEYPGYYDQPHVLNANLTLNKGRTHELGFNFVLRSNRPYTVPNGFIEINELPIPLFFERNNDRLPTYHRLDFSWTIHNFKREKRKWTGDWIMTIYNVYGRNNAENIYFGPKNTGPGLANALFSGSPLGSYQLSIFANPVISLAYRFTFNPK